MLRSRILAALLLAAFSLSACSGTEVELSSDELTITAGGVGSTTITARVLRMGDPEPDATVRFETSAGSFDEAVAEDEQAVTTNARGEATVELFSAKKRTTATVTASYDDEVSNVTVVSSLSIAFVAATGRDLPQGELLALSCDAVNIGALRANAHDLRVTCRLTGKTADRRSLPGGAFDPLLLAEAGSLLPGEDERTGDRVLIYSPEGDGLTPVQVGPDDSLDEPSYVDQHGKAHNPRDGLVTLVAVVDGQEGFDDANSNGLYDRGENFRDAPEPFLDEDDDNKRDESERYVDTNGNGQWDGPNNRYDAETKIMAMFKILWTGAPHVDPSGDPSRGSYIDIDDQSTFVADGGSLEMKAFVLDGNLNPVAAFGEDAGDELEWQVSSDGDAQACGETRQVMDNGYGFAFQSGPTEVQRWRIMPGSFAPLKTHALTLCDTRAGDEAPAREYTVTAVALTSPGRGEDGGYLEQKSYEVGVIRDGGLRAVGPVPPGEGSPRPMQHRRRLRSAVAGGG